MEQKKRSKENDRDARASSLTEGARSPSKKAMADPSPKAVVSSPKGGKRSPTIEATASPSPKAVASSPKGGKRGPTKKATASPSQGTPERNNKRKETAISPSAGSLQGKKRGVLVLLEALDQNRKLQQRRSRSRNDFKLS